MSPDGKLALAGDGASMVRVWETKTRKLVRRIDVACNNQGTVPHYAFSSDCKRVLVGQYGITGAFWKDDFVWPEPETALTFWNTETTQLLRCLDTGGKPVTQVALSPDGQYALATVLSKLTAPPNGGDRLPQQTQRIYWTGLWDTATGKLIGKLPEPIGTAAFSRDSRVATSNLASDGKVKGWIVKVRDVESQKELTSIATTFAENVGPRCLAFSNDGHLIAAGTWKGVTCWRLADQKVQWSYPADNVLAVSFSPDDKQFLLTSVDTDWLETLPIEGARGGTEVLDAQTGKAKAAFQSPKTWVRAAVFTPDGNSILAGMGYYLTLFDVKTGTLTVKFTASTVNKSP
jgi:WD40 repeat protein